VTDFERLLVAWDTWLRRSATVCSGVRIGPLAIGALIAGGIAAVSAIKPIVAW
jgi:hypothetical protein